MTKAEIEAALGVQSLVTVDEIHRKLDQYDVVALPGVNDRLCIAWRDGRAATFAVARRPKFGFAIPTPSIEFRPQLRPLYSSEDLAIARRDGTRIIGPGSSLDSLDAQLFASDFFLYYEGVWCNGLIAMSDALVHLHTRFEDIHDSRVILAALEFKVGSKVTLSNSDRPSLIVDGKPAP